MEPPPGILRNDAWARKPAKSTPSFSRWLLRECIRANPLYVISAALLGYGVQELTRGVDPQIGHTSSILLAAGFLHLYELAILAAATLVLRNRREGGRDMHGLLIVAALYLSGGLFALDEILNVWPGWAPAWVLGSLGLAALKLTWYAHLPGLRLPPQMILVTLGILSGHFVPALLASAPCKDWLSPDWAQGLGWFAAWASLLPLIVLLGKELRGREEFYRDFSVWKLSEAEVPRSHLTTVWLVGISTILGQVHAYAADWIFDRGVNWLWHASAGCVLINLWLLYRHMLWRPLNGMTCALVLAPGLIAMRAMIQTRVEFFCFGAETQVVLAAISSCLLLCWATRQAAFLAGLALPLAAPVVHYLQRNTQRIPQFRALLSVGLGFITLLAGVLVSLKRKALLQWLESEAGPGFAQDEGNQSANDANEANERE